MRTCVCGSKKGQCPECGEVYPHGTTSRCTKPACQRVNAPVDCSGCGRVVSDKLDGVLTFTMELVPWRA